MKKLLIIAFLFLFSFGLSAQELQLVDASSDVVGQIGGQVETPLKFTNNTDKPIQVRVFISEKDINASQSLTLCLGDECFEDVDELPMTITLIPEEILEDLRIVLDAGQSESFGSVIVRIEDINNPSNSIEHEMNLRIDAKLKDALYASGDMLIGTVYPNPVREVAMIDYKLKDDEKDVKIILHNVLGSTVEEFELNPFENQLKFYTSEYNPGVYFYTLYIDNDGITTKKMIVRN